jgi:hypothetical protein
LDKIKKLLGLVGFESCTFQLVAESPLYPGVYKERAEKVTSFSKLDSN